MGRHTFMQEKLLTFLLHMKKLITRGLLPSGCNGDIWMINLAAELLIKS